MEPRDVTYFETPDAFRAWLRANHSRRDGLWVGYWRKATRRASISWEESVDEALCFGWIDGIRKRPDEEAYTIRFTPRRKNSAWSRRNIDRYAALRAAGRIDSAGVTAFEQWVGQTSGRYSFEQVPPPALSDEFLARLRAHKTAWADWEKRPPGYRRQVAHWVMSAKRESTRQRRFSALLEDSAAGRKVKPLR